MGRRGEGLVSADCGIDFYAGPSEIVIVSNDGTGRWIAADLLAQAEHDPDARAVLITPNRRSRRGSRSRCERRCRRWAAASRFARTAASS